MKGKQQPSKLILIFQTTLQIHQLFGLILYNLQMLIREKWKHIFCYFLTSTNKGDTTVIFPGICNLRDANSVYACHYTQFLCSVIHTPYNVALDILTKI